jgi:hypothetical protein
VSSGTAGSYSKAHTGSARERRGAAAAGDVAFAPPDVAALQRFSQRSSRWRRRRAGMSVADASVRREPTLFPRKESPMNKTQILLGVVLAVFGFENAWALAHYGFVGTWENLLNAGFPTRLVIFDLLIALSLVMVWMWNDARERGATLWPYLLLTVTLGSVGPLLYLIRRGSSKRVESGVVAAHALRTA